MKEKTQPSKKELKPAARRSYLLRLWCSAGPGGANWHASLEIPETGERIGFAVLEELFAYLMDQTTGPESLSGESN